MRSSKQRAEHRSQLTLALNTWGGKRTGAGRPHIPGSGVPHVTRKKLAARNPVLVTTR